MFIVFKLRDLVLTVVLLYLASARVYSVERIGLIADPDAGPATRYALNRLETLKEKFEIETAKTIEELEASKVILAGHQAWPVLHDILSAKNIAIPKKPESLVIRQLSWQDKQVVLVTGSDDTGVMYGVLDVAERISWAKKDQNVFDPIIDTTESPFTPERALSIYTMHRELWEQHFYDKQYWTRLLDMLATNRFNSFVLICGYSPATFLAPAYPYFYDVDGFPEVRFENLTDEQQQRNLDMPIF
jgi:hypothetical protein